MNAEPINLLREAAGECYTDAREYRIDEPHLARRGRALAELLEAHIAHTEARPSHPQTRLGAAAVEVARAILGVEVEE